MKLSLFFVTVLTFQLSAVTTWSQNEKLTLKMENSTITDVLSSIEAQTGLSFFYQDEQLKSVSPVNVDANGETVTEVLTDILSNTNLDFRIVDKHVVIFPHEEKPGNAPLNQQDELLVRGKVTDSQGESIPGVTITVKGTSGGTITDIDGNFSIMVDEAADILIFSFVGMKSQEVSIGDRNEINVTLEEDLVGLDEVVVVGYGSMRKSDMTGTVASIPQDRLEMVPNVDITQAIQGAMPGITISTNSAGAAPNSSILIRGRNSIKASNNPLVVLDGIPYEGALSDISPNDIKSIEVLKDASSAAIYGSRGANGVILVTTKQGRKGETVISYDGYYSLQKMANFPELLNGEEFYKFKMERNPSTMTEAEQEIYESGEWLIGPISP
ncbi:SusC/RagA family TonB-linked outer membrane protein [Marinilabilia salmonicolor]|uniref:SusC/RagA family TonB-linked outer membrane protein n=1 Tax=Marinilabilia salmonicolor TaxID=989 RepID=UPI00131ED7FF|nr:SusC/RagA family TonB-linked outer membrane protein [Marinilabilia salmonicolor]